MRNPRHRTVAQAEAAADDADMVAGTGGASNGAADPKLAALRQQMAAADGGKGVDVYVIPTEDPHMVTHRPTPTVVGYAASMAALLVDGASDSVCLSARYDGAPTDDGMPERNLRECSLGIPIR